MLPVGYVRRFSAPSDRVVKEPIELKAVLPRKSRIQLRHEFIPARAKESNADHGDELPVRKLVIVARAALLVCEALEESATRSAIPVGFRE